MAVLLHFSTEICGNEMDQQTCHFLLLAHVCSVQSSNQMNVSETFRCDGLFRSQARSFRRKLVVSVNFPKDSEVRMNTQICAVLHVPD